MQIRLTLAAIAGAILMWGAADAAEVTVIHAGQLLAVPGQAPLAEKSIVIRDGKIAAVEDGYVSLDEADVDYVDLKNAFVLPGLMDLHVHLSGELGPRRKLDRVEMNNSDVAIRALMYARRTLNAGFTTVRDVGGEPEVVYALRDGIAKGYVMGPRIVASGNVSATGGHMDVNGFRFDILDLWASRGACNGPYDCRRAVRERIKMGADMIKIPATGGVLSETATGTGQQLFDDELKEIVTTAHALGRKVAAHAHGAQGVQAALRAGVDSIEHGSFTDAEAIRLFKQTGAYLVPTLVAGETVVRMAKETDFMAPEVRAKALAVGPQMTANIKAAYEAGVKIAFGTDSGVSKHGENAREFVLMTGIGMTNMEAIYAATVAAADLLSMSDTIGTIEVDKAADIIATDGSPLDNIEELLDVDFVMKGGEVVKD